MRVPPIRSGEAPRSEVLPLLGVGALALAFGLAVVARAAPLASATSGDRIEVTATEIRGRYEGPEILTQADVRRLGVRKPDIAHQFSNRMVDVVAAELKARAAAGVPVRVDLSGVRMTTEGMDQAGDVVYTLAFPLRTVASGEGATHFDHRGGWGHEGVDTVAWRAALQARYEVEPDCTDKLRTPEGLVETWCQWGDPPAP